MHTLDEVKAAEDALAGKVDAVIAAVADLRDKLANALPGVLTPEQQATVDALFDEATAAAAKLDAANPPA